MRTEEMSDLREIDLLYDALENSDFVLLGAGAGLSAAAGISFADEGVFARRYPYWYARGLRNEYQMISFRDWTEGQRWAYYAAHIQAVRYDTPPLPLYGQLLRLLAEKDYFVITSNVDRQFWRSGFPEERLLEAQGTYDWLKCSQRCTDRQWDIQPFISEMLAHIRQDDFAVAEGWLPRCPSCGAALDMAFRDYAGYEAALARYRQWLARSEAGSLCMMEMGVGFNSAGVIRVPFERMVGQRDRVRFFRITADYPDSEEEIAYPEIPRPIADKSVSINADAAKVIAALLARAT